MKNQIAQFQAQIDNITAKKDNTLSIRLGTQELNSNDTANLFEFRNKQIWVAFSEIGLKKEDLIIPENLEFPNEKSLSERLRNVIYVYWKQNRIKEYPDFEAYRKIQMEKIINTFKDKLE